jgi:hypothetical protein
MPHRFGEKKYVTQLEIVLGFVLLENLRQQARRAENAPQMCGNSSTDMPAASRFESRLAI